MKHIDLDDDMTELRDANIPRVDAVDKAANGLPFILMKSEGPNLLDADTVRDLLKTDAQEGGAMTDLIDAPVVVTKDEILEDAPAGAEGDVNTPSSPAWEAVDAATAWAQLAMLSDVKRALELLTDREGQEAFAGDDDGMDNAWDLSIACDLVDQAIAIVAPYAVGEQDDSEQSVEKSEATPREVLVQFVKAGRALSAANESALRGAAAAINNVLASLPAAEITKADEMIDEIVSPVEKAKGDPQVLVYDAKGNVVGSVDAANLTTFSNSADPDAADDAADDAGEDPATDAADDSTEDLTPDDEVGTPADAPEPAPEAAPTPDDTTVVKSQNVAEVVKAALDEQSVANAAIIKGLEDRIAHLEAPAPSRVLSNGAVPPADQLRGQDAGAPAVYNGIELRKQRDAAGDTVTKEAINEAMRVQALEALSDMRTLNR